MFTRSRAAEFRARTESQPDDDFVRGCGFEPGSEGADRALAIRRAIARCGSVKPEFIRHDHRWPADLGRLNFWDSLDHLGFFLECERELGLRVPTESGPEYSAFRDWFYSGFMVSELVRRLFGLIAAPRPPA